MILDQHSGIKSGQTNYIPLVDPTGRPIPAVLCPSGSVDEAAQHAAVLHFIQHQTDTLILERALEAQDSNAEQIEVSPVPAIEAENEQVGSRLCHDALSVTTLLAAETKAKPEVSNTQKNEDQLYRGESLPKPALKAKTPETREEWKQRRIREQGVDVFSKAAATIKPKDGRLRDRPEFERLMLETTALVNQALEDDNLEFIFVTINLKKGEKPGQALKMLKMKHDIVGVKVAETIDGDGKHTQRHTHFIMIKPKPNSEDKKAFNAWKKKQIALGKRRINVENVRYSVSKKGKVRNGLLGCVGYMAGIKNLGLYGEILDGSKPLAEKEIPYKGQLELDAPKRCDAKPSNIGKGSRIIPIKGRVKTMAEVMSVKGVPDRLRKIIES